MSEKAKGKRRAIDVIAEAAESMQTPPQVETAAPDGDVLDEATAAYNKVEADSGDFHRKHSEARASHFDAGPEISKIRLIVRKS